MAANDISISVRWATRLVQAEKYVLPLVCIAQAWHQLEFLHSQRAAYAALKAVGPLPLATESLFTGGFIKHVLLLALLVFTSGTLLLSRTPIAPSAKLKHVLVPLAMSNYFILYGIVDDLPFGLGQNLLPERWQIPVAVGGVVLSAIGYSVSIWAVCYLRRSFAIFVSVRTVVLGGPYAYVRHPIYFGYLLDSVGLLWATCSVAMLVLVAGFVGLLICRAKLEEDKLSEVSPAYQQHRQQTGFLFPRR